MCGLWDNLKFLGLELLWLSCCNSFGGVSAGNTHRKYVIVSNPVRIPNGSFKVAIANYSRLRDYYKRPQASNNFRWYYTALLLVSGVAEYANATVLEEHEICHITGHCDTSDKFNFPWIWPTMRTLDNSMVKKTILTTWKDYHGSEINFVKKSWKWEKVKRESPTFSLVKGELLNFYYCNIPSRLEVSPWAFTMFTDPFENTTWILLSVCFIIMTVLLIQTAKEGGGLVVLLLFSASLQLATEALSRKSGLFIMWLATSMIFVFIYSGEVTGKLISPPQDDIITKISELYERNYRLYVHYKTSKKLWYTTAQFLKPDSQIRNNFEHFLKTIVVDNTSKNYHDELYFRDNTFTLRSWVYVLNFVWKGNRAIQNRGRKDRQQARRCHVGQELIKFDETFFVTRPPDNARLAKGYQLLFQTGVVDRLVQEVEQAFYSDRVQDRVRIVSRTKVKVETDPYVDLTMQTKMVTVFLLWAFCLIASINEFAAEKIYFCIVFSTRMTQVDPSSVKVGQNRNEGKKVTLEYHNFVHDTFGDLHQNLVKN